MKTIGDVRKEILQEDKLDVSIERLRHYESLGLFKSARDKKSNFRLYNEQDVEHIKQIVRFIELGVKIKDIKQKNLDAMSFRKSVVQDLLTKV